MYEFENLVLSGIKTLSGKNVHNFSEAIIILEELLFKIQKRIRENKIEDVKLNTFCSTLNSLIKIVENSLIKRKNILDKETKKNILEIIDTLIIFKMNYLVN